MGLTCSYSYINTHYACVSVHVLFFTVFRNIGIVMFVHEMNVIYVVVSSECMMLKGRIEWGSAWLCAACVMCLCVECVFVVGVSW